MLDVQRGSAFGNNGCSAVRLFWSRHSAATVRLGRQNVILMIADGGGHNQWLAASMYQGRVGASKSTISPIGSGPVLHVSLESLAEPDRQHRPDPVARLRSHEGLGCHTQ